MEEEEEYQPRAEEILPLEVHTLTFYGKPLLAVTLPDGRPAVSIRSICSNMELDRKAQVRRIKRTVPIAGDLIENVMIDLQTGGGPQPSQVLVLRSLAYWLTGIDHKRTRPEMQDEILRYQCEAVDALYMWAGQRTKALPASTEHAIQAPGTREQSQRYTIMPPDEPGPEAPHREQAAYHEYLSIWHRHQADLHAQAWRGEIDARIEEQESRLEAREAITDLIPDILERLGPERLTPAHRQKLQQLVKQLNTVTGKPYPTIYDEFKGVFGVGVVEELLEDDWAHIESWFKVQIERARTGKSGKV